VTSSASYDSVDPRFALNWTPNDDVMIYGSVAKGYKSGGLNRQFDPVAQDILPFDKEESTAYELGIKATLFGGRGQINAAAFSTEYENFQLERLVNLVPQVENVGNIDVSGAEADFRFLLSETLEVFGSLSMLDTEVKTSIDPTLIGNSAPMAAESSGSLGAKFITEMADGDFEASAVYTFSDNFFFDIENTLEQPSYSTIDARAAWSNDRWGVALIGENLTDEEYLAEAFVFLDVTAIRAWGRLLRLEAHLNF